MLTLPNAIKNWLRPWPKKLIGLSLTDTALILVQVEKLHSPEPFLQSYGIVPLPESFRKQPLPVSDMADFIRENGSRLGISGNQVALSLPEKDAVLCHISLPDLTASEWKEAALWEAMQYVPYEPGTFSSVLEPLPKSGTRQEGLIAATPTAHFQAWQGLCDQLGWELVMAQPAVLSFAPFLPEKENSLLLHVEGEAVSLHAYKGRLPVASQRWEELPREGGSYRPMYRPPGEDLDEEGWILEKARAWSRVCLHLTEYLSRQDGLSFSRVYLVGNDRQQLAWLPELEAQLHLPCCRLLPDSGPFTIHPKYEPQRLEKDGPELLSALGCLLPGIRPYFLNLADAATSSRLPRAYLSPLRKLVCLTTVLMCLATSLTRFWAENQLSSAQNSLKRLLPWVERREKSLALAEGNEKALRFLRGESSRRLDWYALLTRLGTTLPDPCCLIALEAKEAEGKRWVELKGKTRSRRHLFQWTETLKHQPDVARVTVERVQQDAENLENSRNAIDFSVRIEYHPEVPHES